MPHVQLLMQNETHSGRGPQVKIKTTPLPYAYSVHLRTLMIVYLVRPAPPRTRLQI